MKKTAKVMAIVMVVIAIFTLATACSADVKLEITNVYSETRELLREKCISVLEENNISVGDAKIKASYSSNDGVYLYFQDYRIKGEYDSVFYNALVLQPEDEYIQSKATELLERLEFELDGDSIVYEDTISEDFENDKAEVKVVESRFKEVFKADLTNFLESEGHHVNDPFIKVTTANNGYQIRLNVKEKDEYGVEDIKVYHIYFDHYEELEKVAEALINGKEIKMPDYKYNLTNYCYIEVELND